MSTERLHVHTRRRVEMQAVLQTPLHRKNTSTVDMTDIRLAYGMIWSQIIYFYHEIFIIKYLQERTREMTQ